MKKMLLIMITCFFAFVLFGNYYAVMAENQSSTDNTTNSSEIEYINQDYEAYLNSKEMITPQNDPIIIKGNTYLKDDSSSEVYTCGDFVGSSDAIYTPEEGSVTWNVTVPETGFYNIDIRYYPIEGKSSSIERSVAINGVTGFTGADDIVFPRIWSSASAITQDTKGNDIVPQQVEAPDWEEMLLQDNLGYVMDPYLFYFNAGVNTITFDSIKEPMVIDYLKIQSQEKLLNYSQTLQKYQQLGYTEQQGVSLKVQAEDAVSTTSPTLFPISDRTSSLDEPFSYSKIKLNSIGGQSWNVNGDSITWDVDVPASGLYEISFRALQDFVRGTFVNRKLLINGQVPFQEAENLEFVYNAKWQMVTLGNGGDSYYFYLEKGIQQISLQASLGVFGNMINQVETTIVNLNKLYRDIIIYTGPTPDPFRDYQIVKRIPDLVSRLQAERNTLQDVVNKMTDITGQQNDDTAILTSFIIELNQFIKKPNDIQKHLVPFNGNISALGTWVQSVSAQPLTLDYLIVHSSDVQLPKAHEGFFQGLWKTIRMFFASFQIDYSTIGSVSKDGDKGTITVWIPTPAKSRAQANIIEQLISQEFTPQTGINVDLKLVSNSVLLPATLTGNGPDVAMSLDQTLPVNYAERGAVYDISQFSDFNQVAERFQTSAIVPYDYNGGCYALPEEQSFLMMFYRTDIFKELGLEVPKTWGDVISLIPELQKYNLQFYLPVGTSTDVTSTINPVFATLLFQNGAQFYNNDNSSTTLDQDNALGAFAQWTKFFTAYQFPIQANFVNRFRSGEMPIGIADYTTYNTLSVFAPEIRNDWDFAQVPGTVELDSSGNPTLDSNGNQIINNSTSGNGLGMILLNSSTKKDLSWEFMKWFTSTDTQVQYGRELESILGAGARYPTANIEALQESPWPTSDLNILEEQWNSVVGIPQIPGSYITARNITNAFFDSYTDGTNPREAILAYILNINNEITRKRLEFGLNN